MSKNITYIKIGTAKALLRTLHYSYKSMIFCVHIIAYYYIQ